MKTVRLRWQGELKFEVETESGVRFGIDTRSEPGGYGPTPTQLLLSAVGGCTGMDVAAILAKQRVQVDRLEVEVRGFDREEHPKIFERLEVVYRVWGPAVPEEKLLRAIELSETKYCRVINQVRGTAEVVTRHEINPA